MGFSKYPKKKDFQIRNDVKTIYQDLIVQVILQKDEKSVRFPYTFKIPIPDSVIDFLSVIDH